jgi:hypothetical protein
MEVRSQGAASSDVDDRGRGRGAYSEVDGANDSPRKKNRDQSTPKSKGR